MSSFKTISIQKRVYENNDLKAAKVRADLKANKTCLMNLMSSPGSGKTTLTVATIKRLQENFKVGVIEADIDSDVDAKTVSTTGAKVMQLNSGGMCHLDAGMTVEGLEAIGYKSLDFVILENIGNLICPASYDLGQSFNLMILSVPEGHDKPLKYPKMFSNVDVLVVSKIDTAHVFDFDFELLQEYVTTLNPSINVFPLSAKTGEGMEEYIDYLTNRIEQWRD